jgi:2-iminoacetate synthase ThiH
MLLPGGIEVLEKDNKLSIPFYVHTTYGHGNRGRKKVVSLMHIISEWQKNQGNCGNP